MLIPIAGLPSPGILFFFFPILRGKKAPLVWKMLFFQVQKAPLIGSMAFLLRLKGSPHRDDRHMAKNWVTFASNFSFRPQAPKGPENRRKTAKF